MTLFRPVPLPVDLTDAEQFPEMAHAREHLASLSAERRAELDRQRHDPEFVFIPFRKGR